MIYQSKRVIMFSSASAGHKKHSLNFPRCGGCFFLCCKRTCSFL
nr:MAG TPA: hypothetical protein [Caudoviricetes sp.]